MLHGTRNAPFFDSAFFDSERGRRSLCDIVDPLPHGVSHMAHVLRAGYFYTVLVTL